MKSLVFEDMVESEIVRATDWTPGVGGHGAVAKLRIKSEKADA